MNLVTYQRSTLSTVGRSDISPLAPFRSHHLSQPYRSRYVAFDPTLGFSSCNDSNQQLTFSSSRTHFSQFNFLLVFATTDLPRELLGGTVSHRLNRSGTARRSRNGYTPTGDAFSQSFVSANGLTTQLSNISPTNVELLGRVRPLSHSHEHDDSSHTRARCINRPSSAGSHTPSCPPLHSISLGRLGWSPLFDGHSYLSL